VSKDMGRTVLTASKDKAARLWDLASGKQLHILRGHEDAVESAQFSPDGKTVPTAGGETVRLWHCGVCRPTKEIAPALAYKIERRLTDGEIRQYGVPDSVAAATP
jgi:WD40 repeat protein